MKTIKNYDDPFVIFASDPGSILNFRKELILNLIDNGFKIHLICPEIKKIPKLVRFCNSNNINFSEIKMSRYSVNIFTEIFLIIRLFFLIKRLRPMIMFSYTIKPNLYGMLVSVLLGVKNKFVLITGLGSIFRSGDLSYFKKLFFWVYRRFIIRADCIFFQNRDDLESFKNLNFIGENQQTLIVNGSGVNLKHFPFSDLPNINKLSFLMISRLLIDKGVIEYLDAAKHFINSYPRIAFHLLGWAEDTANSISKKDFREISEQKNINLIDKVDDVRPVIRSSHVLVHPSYHEGMPRSVLESMSMGRPIITTNAPGCRDSIIDGYNGYLVNARDSQSLIKAIAKIINTPSKLKNMSYNSRKLAEQKFDVRIVNKLIIDKIINLI